jgi:hypothetical protein
MSEIQYFYDELNSVQRDSAIASMYFAIRDGLKFQIRKLPVDKGLMECVIKKLVTTFDEFGMIVEFSRKYEKMSIEIIENLFKECNKNRKR